MRWLSFIWLAVSFAHAADPGPAGSAGSESGGSALPRLSIIGKNSASKEVEALIQKLVSTRPPPHPDGYWLSAEEEVYVNLYATPAVTNAIAHLKEKGPSIFPYLV